MKFIVVACLMLVSVKAFPQYPFENYPAINYKQTPIRVKTQTNAPAYGEAKHGNYTVKILQGDKKTLAPVPSGHKGNLLVYYKDKLIEEVAGSWTIVEHGLENVGVYFGDINGDKRLDIKIAYYTNLGAGLASYKKCSAYFFGNKNGSFSKFIISDFGEPERAERDLDNDGNHEIVIENFLNYKGHSYWVFNLLSFENGRLENLGEKHNYPIAVQLLNKKNFKVSNAISRLHLKKLIAPALKESISKQ